MSRYLPPRASEKAKGTGEVAMSTSFACSMAHAGHRGKRTLGHIDIVVCMLEGGADGTLEHGISKERLHPSLMGSKLEEKAGRAESEASDPTFKGWLVTNVR